MAAEDGSLRPKSASKTTARLGRAEIGTLWQMIEILALAGNGGNAARWARLPIPLDDRSAKAEGVMLRPIELPGFDCRPLPATAPTIDDFAGWAADQLGAADRPRVFFGTGIGGSIGLQVAQRQGVADAYIFHSPVGPNLDTRLLPRLMKPAPLRRAVKHAIGGTPGRLVLRRKYRDTLPPHIVDDFAQGYLDCDAFEVMWDILTADWFDSLGPVSEPHALMWGGRDGVLGADLAPDFAHVLPHAEVIIEESWGHYPMLENPTSFAEQLASLARRLVT